ncbi:MAG: DUF4262 domain-containing protein [Acidimicrobiales bacterium]|nr:DUF4262 domain-containing protein [Hyphomonadaceae bacterium]RZV43891.1 MAG: DUF4262 domain-containing protein [Acidimicrobiales bacterium]
MAELAAYEKDLIANVEKHGWQATHVFDPDGDAPGFTYSIGFPHTLNCPDFIIFGLPSNLMHSMFWEIFRQIKDGNKPGDGTKWEGLLEGDFVCISRLVHADNSGSNYFNSARWFHQHDGGDAKKMSFMQLFWPGAQNNLYPWDEGCGDDLIKAQPLLYEPGHDYG